MSVDLQCSVLGNDDPRFESGEASGDMMSRGRPASLPTWRSRECPAACTPPNSTLPRVDWMAWMAAFHRLIAEKVPLPNPIDNGMINRDHPF